MNLFLQLWKSLYSPKDIASFRNQKLGKTILYIILLSFFSVLPLFFHFVQSTNEAYLSLNTAIQQLPEFEIKEGKLISDENKPITLDTDQLGTIIFDSTGKVTVEDVEYRTNHAIAFLSDQFVIRFSDQTVNYSYLNLGTEQLTKADITDLISSVNSLKTVIYSVSFIIFYLIQIGTSLVTVTVLALFGILLKGHVQLKYGQLWRMSAYAQTLATVFFMVMHSFNAIVPFGSFINWAVMIIMLYLAIKELRLSTPM